MFPSTRRLRAAATALFLFAGSAHAAPAAPSQPNPHVTAPTTRVAALACAQRSFRFVAHVAGRRWFCVYANPLDEPEAVPVSALLARP